MSSDYSERQSYDWPAAPYKGLNTYHREDAPLFVGRDAEIFECGSRLSKFSTRILVLHGPTGSGKSSFLHAGLIPYLEDDAIGFQFLGTAGKGGRAIFVRATARPLYKLAEALYNFVQENIELTILKDQMLSLDPVLMVQTLMHIARRLPKTLVLVIDQAEEVLTLDAGPEGDNAREQFFKFLQLFSHVKCDMKLILTLRTDFYGQMDYQLQKQLLWVDIHNPLGEEADPLEEDAGPELKISPVQNGIESYFLDVLSQQELVEVIKRPTSKETIRRYGIEYGIPYYHYKFSYEEGLPELIVLDIENVISAGRLAGGVLPVLQILSGRLYEMIKEGKNGAAEITEAHYHQLGSIEEQLLFYLERVVRDLCHKYYEEVLKVTVVEELELQMEVERWIKILSHLTKIHPNNTVTKHFFSKQELEQEALDLKCQVDPEWAISHLTSEHTRILSCTDIFIPREHRRFTGYSLGHDAIGLALQRWPLVTLVEPVEEGSIDEPQKSLLDSIIATAQCLDQMNDKREEMEAIKNKTELYARRFRVTAERVKLLADKIYHRASFRPSSEELQVLATQPESYYPRVLQRGTEGAPIFRPPRFDKAATSIEEEGGEAGALAKSMKAKAAAAKA